jgi:hypothetical protein
MAIEPFSETTLHTKRNLLVAGTLAITYRAFDVSVEKIPVAGIVIDFNRGIFAFLLVVVLFYFLVSFAVYFFIDVKNFEQPPHQLGSLDRLSKALTARVSRLTDRIEEKINGQLSDGDFIRLEARVRGDLLELQDLPKLKRRAFLRELNVASTYGLLKRDGSLNRRLERDKHRELYERVDRLVASAIRRSIWFEAIPTFLQRRRHSGVTFVYLLRSYILDGLFPFLLGVVGLLAMYGYLPLDWLRYVAPSQ